MARRGGRGAAREMERSGVVWGEVLACYITQKLKGESSGLWLISEPARDIIKSRVERRRGTVSLCRNMERCPEWKPVVLCLKRHASLKRIQLFTFGRLS